MPQRPFGNSASVASLFTGREVALPVLAAGKPSRGVRAGRRAPLRVGSPHGRRSGELLFHRMHVFFRAAHRRKALLDCGLCDPRRERTEHGVHQNEERLCALLGDRGESAIELVGRSCLDDLKPDLQLRRRRLCLRQLLRLENTIRRIPGLPGRPWDGPRGATPCTASTPRPRVPMNARLGFIRGAHTPVASSWTPDTSGQGRQSGFARSCSVWRTISLLNRVPRRTKRLAAS